MSTLTAPTRPTPGTDHEPCHGAHIDCQWARPTVKTVCGVELEWDDMANPDASEQCVVCRDLLRCPVCGIDLVFPS